MQTIVDEDLVHRVLEDIANGELSIRDTLQSVYDDEIRVHYIFFKARPCEALRRNGFAGEGARRLEVIYQALADRVGVGLAYKSMKLTSTGLTHFYTTVEPLTAAELRDAFIDEANLLLRDKESPDYLQFLGVMYKAWHMMERPGVGSGIG